MWIVKKLITKSLYYIRGLKSLHTDFFNTNGIFIKVLKAEWKNCNRVNPKIKHWNIPLKEISYITSVSTVHNFLWWGKSSWIIQIRNQSVIDMCHYSQHFYLETRGPNSHRLVITARNGSGSYNEKQCIKF